MLSRCNPKRLWRVHHAIKALLNRGRCSGKALEVVIGHCTFLGLICRPGLSCFHAVYGFIKRFYDEVATMWETVVKELRTFMGISFLLVQDRWRPWNRLVTSSDSSLVGYGACKSWWPQALVAEVGRVQERSRFKRNASHSARESALTQAGFHMRGGSWTLMDEKMLGELAESGWSVNADFPEVPSGSLKRHLWTPVFWGKWNHPEKIGILEARAVLKSLRRLCLTRYGHDIRHLHLCDNLGIVLSVERCRSKSFKILKIIRNIAAYCLSRNVHLSVRWIPSELNASDEPSRICDPEESKLLLDLVRAVDFEFFSPQTRNPPHGAETSATQIDTATADCTEQAAACASQSEEAAVAWSRGQSKGQREASAGSWSQHGSYFKASDSQQGARLAAASHRPGAGDNARGQSKMPRGGDREWKHFIRMEGRKKRREQTHTAKETKKAAASQGGQAYEPDSNRYDYVGGSFSWPPGSRAVQQEMGGVTDPCQTEGCVLQQCQVSRHHVGRPLHAEVFRRRRPSLWGLHDGGVDGSKTRVQSPRRPQSSESLEGFEGMEKVVSTSLEACLPPCSMVWPELADGCTWASSYGPFQPTSGLNLSSPWQSFEATEDGAGKAHCWDYLNLVNGDQPQRGGGHIESGIQGRQYPAGLSVAAVCPSFACRAFEGKTDGLCLGVQLPRIPEDLQHVCEGAQTPCGAVSGSPLRAQHRPGQQGERSGRSADTRWMVDEKECDEIREGGATGSQLAQAGPICPVNVQKCGAIHRQHHARPRLSRHSTAFVRHHRGYLADFFAGTGGVSRAARSLGFSTREWELLHGPDHDLTKPLVQFKIKHDIEKGILLAAMLAPPCSSFSQARNRTMVVRDRLHPWGLDDLPLHEREKVEVGNACFRATFKIIKWLDKHHIPWILENPSTSKKLGICLQ